MTPRDKRPTVAVVGPLAPPSNGMTAMTEQVLSSDLAREFQLVHVDLSDHREIGAIARLDFRNAWLAFRHAAGFLFALARRPALCYVPIARNRLGFLRDSVLLLTARTARRTSVVHLHGSGFREFYEGESWLMRLLVQAALNGHTHAIVLGGSRRSEFRGLIDDSRIHVVPNGIRDHAGPNAAATPREPVVLYLGTLMREKGVFDLLQAAPVVLRKVPGARLVFAGPWSRPAERAEAIRFLHQHELAGRVEFVGPTEGAVKTALLARAAVLALPSTHEGQPVVVLEALCSGTPVVATRVGCLTETIDDDVEGYLVEPGDTDALSARLVQLLSDEPLRRRMGESARRRYEAAFTLDTFSQRLADAWRTAL